MKLFAKNSFYIALLLMLSCNNNSHGDGVFKEISILANVNVAIGENVVIKAKNHPTNFQSLIFDFGDGTKSSGETEVIKVYEKAGTYKITLNIVSVGGKNLSAKRLIKVEGTGITRLMQELTQNDKVLVMAHRGCLINKSITENSIAAVNACVSAGIDVFEADTHITKDGHVVICHDATIDRTTNGTGTIANMTLAKIKQYRLKDRNGNITNETVPTLEELLMAGRGKILFNLDYSPRTASTADVYNVVSACDMVDRVFFYTGGKATYVNEVFGISDNKAHPYPWGGKLANYQQCIGLGRKFFVQLDQTNLGSSAMETCLKQGMVISVNVLNSEFETAFISGDFRQIDEIINSNVRMIQTDIGDSLLGYLKIKGKR